MGIALDITQEHVTRPAAKIGNRNDILRKLCGNTWGSLSSVLRASVPGLASSAAEYGATVWGLTVILSRNATLNLISLYANGSPIPM